MRTSTTARAGAAVVLLMALIPAPAATSAPSRADVADAHQQVDRLERELEDAERQAEEAEEELSDVESELREAAESLAAAEQLARAAEQTAQLAVADADAARATYERSRRELRATRDGLDSFVRRTYMHGPAATAPGMAAFEQLTRSGDVSSLADTLHTVELVIADRADLVTDARQLVDVTARLSTVAEDAEQVAADRLAAAAASRDEAASRHAEVMTLFDRVSALLAARETLVATTTKELTDSRDRASRLETERAEAQRAAEEAAQRPVAPVAPGPPVPAGGGLVTVGGITVAASLGPQLQGLLAAAAADGIALRGSGYRSPAAQARLRIVNGCPDVYEAPASACRVPTAPPGNSMHERGLAVDFIWQGRTVCYPRSAGSCRGNAAFDWLAANAGRFGLYVLPSEAWHWSTNGN